ncbi:LRR receptor-like serine/threonine-protein kinase FEI [Thalictrum thalictroides]|uniref:LRR receptor-like serine/threonine-protein kinase FEI n=1 Tax=Thalictrum thalictroides TaxID=46969 RepID=A0A7J6X1H4_THATH|nr:LRR receptor-like serine/threonine-protein kinase FEI [Thalictrum thalictroides]
MGILVMKTRMRTLLFILLLSLVIQSSFAISPDGEALLSFKAAIVRSNGDLLQWKEEDPDPCRWNGVRCDPTKRVISLILPHRKLMGPISPDIGKLNSLNVLDLRYNALYGIIPPELGNCTLLKSM